MKRFCLVALVSFMAVGIACSDTETVDGPQVTVSGPISVLVGDTITLTAMTINGTDGSYVWSSSDDGVAGVDEAGLVTGVAEGEATITAIGVDSAAEGAWGVHVYVEDTAAEPRVVVGGQVAVTQGETAQLTAQTLNGTDSGYAWVSSDDAIATVDDAGLVTGVAGGEVLITATGGDTGEAGGHGMVVIAVTEEGVEVPFEDLWAGSGHADAESESFVHWDEDGEIPADCAKCHSTPGYLDFLGEDGSAAGTVDAAAPTGSVVTCVACHNAATLALDSVVFPSGAKVTGLGAEARCLQCHQGRESTDSVDAAIAEAAPADDDTVSGALGFRNVHYAAAGATMFGAMARGGYQYDGLAYDVKFAHVPGYDTCNSCHDPHTLQVRYEECTDCHVGVASAEDARDIRMAGSLIDYDGDGDATEGMHYEIEGLIAKLYAAIQDYAANDIGTAIIYDSHSYPYFFKDTNENGEVDEGEASFANQYDAWTARLVRAAYNFQFAQKDTGAYAHGGKYVIELLFDSIADLGAADAVRVDAGHFDGSSESWRHWDETGVVPAGCAKCHSATGLGFYLAAGTNLAEPASNGMLCETCHGSNDDYETQYVVDGVKFPSGAVVDAGNNTTNICLNCHQGRESTVSVNAAIGGAPDDDVMGGLGFKNVHYAAAGATMFGGEVMGAYQYAGKFYDGRFDHVTTFANCADCHDAHNLNVKVADCADCHAGVETAEDLAGIRMVGSTADYDGDGDVEEGIAGEIDTMIGMLYAAIQDYALDTIGTAIEYNANRYPYFFTDGGEQYSTWTPRLLRAAYNYQYALKDHGAYTHNAKYMIQVLFDSIEDIGGEMMGLVRGDSGHFDSASEAFRHWDEDGEVVAACARCHSGEGFIVYAETGADPVAAVKPTDGLSCEVCHTGGDFAGEAPVRAIASVTFPGGTVVANTDGDSSFICMSCHMGREGKLTIDAAIDDSSFGFKNVHYLPAAAVLYGSDVHVGYEYDGKTYAGKFAHIGNDSAQCGYCHVVDGDSHEFLPVLKGSCTGCHSEAGGVLANVRKLDDDLDGDGIDDEPLADELAALGTALYAQFQVYATDIGSPIVYDAHAYPYFFKDTNNNGLVDPGEAIFPNQYDAWDATLMKAAHNLQLHYKEPGAWAHNSAYAAQLLIDSIDDLGGDVTGYERP